MGFNQFYDISKMRLEEHVWGAPDKDVFRFVLKKLEAQGEPFFYYIITMSSHEPFTIVRDYYNTNRFDDVPDEMTRNYFISISYVDGVLRDFVQAVRAKHENTYIFIFGDHTPFTLKEKNFRRAVLNIGESTFEFVPLFILTPSGRVSTEDQRVACFLDFSPTVLSAAGIPFKVRSSGVNLLEVPIPEGKVPSQGKNYNRRLLFHLISNQVPATD
jgi:phosphoglycerol transferase MdoB-like AlkP superfamily enzyme